MRDIIIFLIKIILRIFWIFPINNSRIFFTSYDGNQFSCNPKYLFYKLNNEFECVWYLKNQKIENSIIISKKGFKYYYYILTSKVLITNVNFSSCIPFRRKQLLINTWHGGGAYKYAIYNKSSKEICKSYKKFGCFLSSAKIASDLLIRDTFHFNGKILDSGFPRNDIFFCDKSDEIINKIRKYFKIDSDLFNNSLKVIYAPTYRDYDETNYSFEKLNFRCLKAALEERFEKKCILFIRTHHYSSLKFDFDEVYDASTYSDMQELLYGLDILITDYSSCMWDFSITKKPCFLYVYDYEKYNNERAFYTNIEDWAFPISFNIDELCRNILEFNQYDYEKKLDVMRKKWGSFEKGNASDMVYEYIVKEISNGK